LSNKLTSEVQTHKLHNRASRGIQVKKAFEQGTTTIWIRAAERLDRGSDHTSLDSQSSGLDIADFFSLESEESDADDELTGALLHLIGAIAS